MAREPINAWKSFEQGWKDAGAGKVLQFPETPKTHVKNYYDAGQRARDLRIYHVRGAYLAVRDQIGGQPAPIGRTVLDAILKQYKEQAGKAGRPQSLKPAVAIQGQQADDTDRYTVDLNTVFLRALSAYERLVFIPIVQVNNNDQVVDLMTPRPFNVEGIDNVRALRDACDWLLAKAVEEKLTEQPSEDAQTESGGMM